jgi:catechol 2,3-dioxygenase-like lactoylglutathione lyase family enzyme
MIGYTCVGTNDLARATAFYDALFAIVGAKHFFETDRGIGWGTAPGKPLFCVMRPFDGRPATVGNGDMVALVAKDTDQVAALHARALALGGTDEGAPGLRGHDFYGAYFRDLDGNKLAAYCLLPAAA